jgi:hypothetical protein
MKQRFEDILAECLQAVSAGQRTIEDCLALYPQWSDRLEPLLRLGSRLDQTSLPGPNPSFQEAARERFLSATRARAALPQRPRRLLPTLPRLPQWNWRLAGGPALHGRRRAAATIAAALLVVFLGFSSFVVASAGDSLPGDWRYPVKRLTERTRLTFTFGENARRGYRIGLAEERLREVQQLAAHDRPIGESVLADLTKTTQPLVDALEPASVPTDQIERITDLTAKQQDTLDSVAPLVEDEAADELQEAMVVSSEGHEKAVQALVAALAEQPPKETPGPTTPGAGTPTPQAGTSPTAESTPGSSPTAEASATPGQGAGVAASPTPTPEATSTPAEGTAVPGEPTPELPTPSTTPMAPQRQVTVLPDDTTGGITWNLITIGDFSLRVPADSEPNWVVSTLTDSGGERIFVGHRLNTRFDAVIVVQVSTGNSSIHLQVQGVIQEVPAEEVPSLAAGPVADVILHVLESINAGP